MVTFKGTKVVPGIAIGKLFYYKRPEKHIVKSELADDEIEREIEAFNDAKKVAIEQLEELYNTSIAYLGELNASIFVAQEMLLQDGKFNAFVEDRIREGHNNAAYAVALASDEFTRLFAALEDTYMQSHVADVQDVTERLLRILCGTDSELVQPKEPSIFVSDDFNAGDIVQLNHENVVGFATMFGSTVSHASILARTLGTPSIVSLGQEMLSIYDGSTVVLDGTTGKLIIDPDKRTLDRMRRKQEEYAEQQKMLLLLKGKNNVTKSGKYINLYANISGVEGVENALLYDAGGIGLFRSEFIFIEADTYPTEDAQFEIYKEVLEKMRGRRVIIRTLDLGTDKQASYFRPEKENNPALGYRAIRVSLSQLEIFKTQLRALYRASVYGNLSILFPMIISLDEVRKIKAIIKEVKEELSEAKITYMDDVQLGIMVETPAAVMISDVLAKEVDFFSIGTNDLTQYTLAIDRQNPKLEQYYNARHPAVIKMIDMVVKNAHAAGITVDICGELGADIKMTQKFIDIGVDALSVAPNMVLPLRKCIRECD